MFRYISKKKAFVLAVVLLMIATVSLAACDGKAFIPKTLPASGGEVSSNGGNAVQYGEWIYYVNGYQSSASAENTYAEIETRTAAIARIKVENLEKLFAVYDRTDITSSTAKTNEIAKQLKEYAEIVVPNFYYNGNSTNPQLNGIYIFDERLYITTPNDALTAGGNSQTSQLVLTSYKLDGSDRQKHYVFEKSNSVQILLDKIDGTLIATYIMDTEVGRVDVVNKTNLTKVEDTSNAVMDTAGQAVFFTDKDGSICKLAANKSEHEVIVKNEIPEGEEHSHLTYSIKYVNGGNVYYTKQDSSNSGNNDLYLYCSSAADNETVAFKTNTPSTYRGYKNSIVYVDSVTVGVTTMYGIKIAGQEGYVVDPQYNDKSITFDRLDGDVLYYTCNTVAYKVDLSQTGDPVAIGKSLSSASGWSVPDMLGEYVITVSSNKVEAVKFNADTKTNSSSVVLTVVAEED
ncbi:MAG: hypothetical protein NC332_03560 [Firmicutes bacterium]|nr:hypothetical protein [Bacillota bacterium]